ncbi:hypothetical protein NDU88_005699 [Pleurodeles waltl]|uniref:Uncharacterized protein n=1 Tax=Pleurodeles waltl TaxID=8319 RepID=A0AAV7MX53_PLEWA|nr:hypothetical protein NDU88_005699 [Pleurodeles waltl]
MSAAGGTRRALTSELKKGGTDLQNTEREMVTGAVTPEELQALSLRTSEVATCLAQQSELDKSIDEEEVQLALQQRADNKAPGSDGLPAKYYRTCSGN